MNYLVDFICNIDADIINFGLGMHYTCIYEFNKIGYKGLYTYLHVLSVAGYSNSVFLKTCFAMFLLECCLKSKSQAKRVKTRTFSI